MKDLIFPSKKIESHGTGHCALIISAFERIENSFELQFFAFTGPAHRGNLKIDLLPFPPAKKYIAHVFWPRQNLKILSDKLVANKKKNNTVENNILN